MKKLHIKKTFNFAHGGYDVVAYKEGQSIETDDAELIEVSTREGWASLDEKAAKPETTKAKKHAPENK